ncbi:MAG: hypothetical protein HGA67_00905 [Candidatus Yonathbacteria bacterium]|nr:hypothetical protein [Candidatus Yonathbacteria bacterium]
MFRDNIVIAVVRGGKGEFASRSLSAGSAMIKILRDAADVLDVFIDKEGVWHLSGVPRRQADIMDRTDVIVSVIPQASAFRDDVFHSGLLNQIPSIGTGTASGALLSRIPQLYDALGRGGVKTPPMKVYHADGPEGWTGLADDISRNFRMPIVLRPALDEFPDEAPVSPVTEQDGVFRVLHTYGSNPYFEGIVAEEYVYGKRITVYVIDGFRGEASYIVLPVYTFDVDAKMSAPLSIAESRYAQETARMAYDALDIDGFARFDMVMGPSGAYVLGVYTVPDISPASPIHRALAAVGSGEKDLVVHMVNRALAQHLG